MRFVLAAAAAASLFSLAVALAPEPADVILTNGRVYTLAWRDPSPDGAPAADAPHDARGWHPDAQAVAIRGSDIVFVGSTKDAAAYRGPRTRVIDVHGNTILPGLIDAHVHLAELGANLARVDLTSVRTEQEAVARVAARARSVPAGEWIIGWGWDEGAWASHYPTLDLLSRRVPNHPVFLRGLHGFAAGGNHLALERARITAATPAPAGGQIITDAAGAPTGILLNNATDLLTRAIPARTKDNLERDIRAALDAMVRAGYTSVHEAGADAAELAAIQSLARRHELPIRVYVMLAARDTTLLREWLARGPDTSGADNLTVRSVKAFADGALGSRGARLLADYADRPGH